MEHNNIRFADWQGLEVKNGFLALMAGLRLAVGEIKKSRTTRIICWVILAVLALTLWTLVTYRIAHRDAEQSFEVWKERYVNDYQSQEEAKAIGIPPDPKELLLNQQSEALARVLYGVKENSTNDLKTLCWCVFNRVDNPAYPDTLEAVIAQPKQWMGYYEDSPVLDDLYKIAREQIQAWENGRRPVSNEFVYMSWTAARIVLRDTWEYGMKTNTWVWSGEA